MKTRTLIRMDQMLGVPLCALACLAQLPLRWLRSSRAQRPVRRVLVLKFIGMGSVLLATPMLRRLKRTWPEARLTFLTFAANEELVRRLPCVDEVLVVTPRSLFGLALAVPGLLLRLRSARFDVAVDLEFYSRLSNLLTWACGAQRRLGFFVRGRWRGSLLTHSVPFNPTLPYGEVVQALLRPLGPTEDPDQTLLPPHISDSEAELALGRLQTLGVPERGAVVVVNVNASDLCDERRWPEPRFAELVTRFGTEVAAVDRFVFVGTAGEAGVVRRVLDLVPASVRPRCLDLSGRTSLVELSVLLLRANLLLTNDSGPLHLAAALGVPSASLFGPETPNLYGPVGPRHLVFYAGHWCSPCLSVYNAKIAWCNGENECMRRISVEDVVTRLAPFCREQVGMAPADRPTGQHPPLAPARVWPEGLPKPEARPETPR